MNLLTGVTTLLADDAVSTDKIADDAVTAAKLANDCVTVDQISGDAVGTGLELGATSNKLQINSSVATLTGTQTLTNKSLTSPTITGTGAIAGTFTGGLTGDVTGNADTASAAKANSALETALNGKQASITAGTGLSFTNTTLNCDVVNTDTQLTKEDITAMGFIETDTNTTYTAGTGLTLTGTEFTVNAGTVPLLNQNTTGSAATLTTARTIAGATFDGSADIDIPIEGLSNVSIALPNNATSAVTAAIVTTGASPDIDTSSVDGQQLSVAQVAKLVDTINSLRAEVAELRGMLHGALKLTP